MGHGVAYLEAHGVFHLLLNTLAVSHNKQHVDANQDADDKNKDLGADRVFSLHSGLFVIDVLSFVEIDADLGLNSKIGAYVLQNVLWSDVSAEGLLIDSD